MNNSEGCQGAYYDDIYKIKDGKWKRVATGYYEEFINEEAERDEKEDIYVSIIPGMEKKLHIKNIIKS